MTRGDSLNVKVAIVRNKSTSGAKSKLPLPDSREILYPNDLPAGSEVWFAMSRFFPGQVKYKLLLRKPIVISYPVSDDTKGSFSLVLAPKDTRDIPLGIYNYDIKLLTPKPISEQEDSEDVWNIDTFISGEIQLVGECEGEEGIVNDYIHKDGEYEYDDSEEEEILE